jgi:hypothetical protein
MLGFYLLSSLAVAVVLPPTEEELSELADFGFSGSVVEVECTSVSYNEAQGVITENYEAVVLVDTILKGEESYGEQEGTQVSVYYKTYAYDNEPESCADLGDEHMYGTWGNYYVADLSNGAFEILGQFIEGSDPSGPPECPDPDGEPSSEPSTEPSSEGEPSSEPSTEPSSEGEDTGLEKEADGGCSTAGVNDLSLGALLSLFLVLARRRQ